MSTNPAITFSGVGSGIDTASMVKALMDVEKIPVRKIEDSIKKVNTQKGVVQEMNGYLATLRTKAAALFSDPLAMSAKKATSGDDKIVTASAGASAAAGTYNIVVNQLAQIHTLASAGSPPLVAGQTLDVTVNGVTKSVNVDAGDTLADFAARFNSTADIGATASVIDGKLVLMSKTGGTAGAITTGGSAAAGFGFTQTQAAQNSDVTVNGVHITNAGNKLDGTVSGLSIDLKGTGTTTLTVAADDTAVVKKVQEFVDAYNTLQSNLARVTKYDPATKTAGALQGDSLFQGLSQQMRSMLGAPVQGLTGDYTNVFDIGLNTAKEGTLSLDTAKLTEALKKDPSAVQKVLGFDNGTVGGQPTDGIARQIDDLAKQYSTGPIADRLTGYGNRVKDMNDKITRLNENLAMREKRLKQQFQAMDTAVARMQQQQASFMARLGQK